MLQSNRHRYYEHSSLRNDSGGSEQLGSRVAAQHRSFFYMYVVLVV